MILMSNDVTIGNVEFDSLATCEVAKLKILDDIKDINPIRMKNYMFCVHK